MIADQKADLRGLVNLTRNKSQSGRSVLLTVLHDLYCDDDQLLTEQDRAIMADIMQELVHEVEMSVRRSLAEQLAKRTDAPHALVIKLANDEIEVAYPILIESRILHDVELIEIVQHRTMDHQLAIAIRPQISEQVSDALVESENEEVIRILLSNDSAQISDSAIDGLIEASRHIESFQKPLVNRQDLPHDLAKKLYWAVSAALREHIIENYKLDPDELDETIEGTVKDMLTEAAATDGEPAAHRKPPEPVGADDEHILIRLLRLGQVEMFLDKFISLTGLRITLARRILFEPGGEGLAIACKAIGLDKRAFVSVFVRSRLGRLGDKQIDADELACAIAYYDKVEAPTAKAMLRRWHRDPGYLNALRQIEKAK